MKQIIQCVPNFSEGRNLEKVEEIVSVLKGVKGVKLVSYEPDADYNRTVVSLLGEPAPILEAVLQMALKTTELIDLNEHSGQHQRMGALDVVPFIPIRNITMNECVELAKEFGKKMFELTNVPIFFYEEAASMPHRTNLADVRKGQFEGMFEKVKDPIWLPDYGSKVHQTAGVTGVSARLPLIAYNINLKTTDLEIAKKIAKAIRHSSGGFRYIKAGPAELEERRIVQVTMNVTNYQKTSLYRVFETVKMEARRYGVEVCGSEVVGLVPMEALVDSTAYYLGLEDFSMDKVLESHLIGDE